MRKIYIVWFAVLFFSGEIMNVSGQICDPTVPVFTIDLTGSPNGTWTSPPVTRSGLCCIASGGDKCVEFVITLDSAAVGISFDIISGARPGGALYYQVDCGAPSSLGSPVCLTGVGPHYLTFCKPGNNNNEYQIQSFPQPSAGGSQYVSQACTGFLSVQGLDDTSITWTSIPANATYNSYLSCTAGCDSVIVTPSGVAPPFVDYQVCGNVSGACGIVSFCDTVRINFVNTLNVAITPQNPTICFGGTNATVTATPSGGLAPYNYLWSTGATTQSITVAAGTYVVQMTDAMNCSLQYDTVVVNALPSPIAADAGPDQQLCYGSLQSVVLNGSVVAATGGMWMNGTGTFIPDNTTLNATYTPSASEINSGSANLMFVTTGNSGCPADTDYFEFGIAPQPSPAISGLYNVCQYSGQLYVVSDTNPFNYAWTVNGGTITNNLGDSITVLWDTVGTGDVTVIASNIAGCDTTIQFPITVNPQPAPVLTGLSSVCTPATEVYHVSNAMNDIVTWTVSGGTIMGPATSDSIIVQWTSSGSGTVSVTESNILGCDSAMTMAVALSSTPVTSISGLQNICGVAQATYTAAPSNAISYNWSVNGGSIASNNGTSIDVLWNATGANSITLTAVNANGCDTTIIFPVTIYPQPSPVITGAALVCTPATSVYHIANPSANSFSWSVTGGTISGPSNTDSVTVVWNSSGAGVVSVTELNSNGCDSMTAMTINLSSTPVTSVSGQQNICGQQTVIYTASSSNATVFNWTVNGGNIVQNNGDSISVFWISTGAATVSLTAINAQGCDMTIIYPVNLNPTPAPLISGPVTLCLPTASVYRVSSPGINNFTWSVTQGTILGQLNSDSITVQWNNITGTGTVSVTAANAFGCDSTATMSVALSTTPSTYIAGLQNICGQQTVIYTASSSNAAVFNWTVNGGNIMQNNGDSIYVGWTSTGAAMVSLTAINAQGCDTTIIYPVNLNPMPSPVISGPVTLCLPAASVYRVSSPGINNFTWSVTEGTILGQINSDSITVQWNSITGMGTVSVTAANAFGCDSTTTMSVALSVTPSPFITGQQTFCGPQASIYSASTSNASVYNWTINGGNVLANNGDNILVQWDSSVTGSIILTAINAEGCDTTLYYFVDVYPQPQPIVTGAVAACTPATLTYALSTTSNDIYSWAVSGGTISGSSVMDSVQVLWNSSGTGVLSLTEINAYGCDTTVTTYISLSPFPAPSITGIDFLCNEDTATYSVPPVQGHSYNWSVTGGTIISFTVNNSIDVYWYSPGGGSVRVNQISQEGCAAQDVKPVHVNSLPVPGITGALVACLNDQSNYLSGQQIGSSYTWSINGGSINGSPSQPFVNVQWTTMGQDILTVTETDSNGCSASTPLQVFVNPLPVASIFGSQVGCVDPYGSVYTAPVMNNVYYQWSVNGGSMTANNGQNHMNVLWNSSGISLVNLLTLNTATGCRSNTSLQVLVDSMPQSQITLNSFAGCAPLAGTFGINPSVASYSYEWSFGDGGSSGNLIATHTYTTPGSYAITLIITNNSGCWDTVHSQVNVFNAPVADFIVNTSDEFYPADETSFTLQNTSAGAVHYLWSFGDGNTSADFEPAYQYTAPGTYQIMLITTNLYGCRDSMLTSIEIKVPESIYVPNAFTPNGDSRNDGFSVTSRNITELHISIFDRWGEEVYYSNDKNFQWDGSYFGHRVQEGMYVYKISAKGYHGQQFNRTGTVSVLK